MVYFLINSTLTHLSPIYLNEHKDIEKTFKKRTSNADMFMGHIDFGQKEIINYVGSRT